MAAEGAALVLCARGEAVLAQAREAIARRAGVSVTAVAADLSLPEGVRKVVGAALRDQGRVDVLVTNAGGPPPGPFESHDEAAWLAAFRLTLMSAVELARAVLPGMKERRFGRILNITSIAVKQPVDNLVLSTSLRAAVTGMARTLANEAAPYGITVNNLLPGWTRTERLQELARTTARNDGTTPEAVAARWTSQVPAGRLGEPRDLAALAVFLASERAGYVTGQSIAVDGGWIRSLM
jgi:3-oxoacyl-[acyl-carrier protein] reductase